MCLSLQKYLFDPDARVSGAMPLGPSHPLAALFLEHPDLRPPALAVDHGRNPRVGDKRRPGDHLAAVFLDEQHLIERQLCARLTSRPVDSYDPARRDLDLTAAGLNDCE